MQIFKKLQFVFPGQLGDFNWIKHLETVLR